MLQDSAAALANSEGVDWRLIVACGAAIAGWAGFIIQTLTLRRARRQDLEAWNAAFLGYRRNHLKSFAEQLRVAYERYRRDQPEAPEGWEDAVHGANWPPGLPLRPAGPLQSWHLKYRVGLDREDQFLLRFCEAIYPPFNDLDQRPVRERSILEPDEFDIFDHARGGVADYFDTAGKQAAESRSCRRFLKRHVRPNHYYKLKLSAYLDLALVRCWGPTSETGPGKKGLFTLGRRWSEDDRRGVK